MPIKTQIWHPDTCPLPSCVVEQTYDTADPGATMTVSTVIRKCIAHAGVADADLWHVLYLNSDSDQKRKNRTEKYLIETNALNLGTTNPEGVRVWVDGLDYRWSFSGVGQARVLMVGVAGVALTVAQRTLIQNALDAQFGVGRVVFG